MGHVTDPPARGEASSADDTTFSVLFTGSTWRFRLGAYLRSLRTPRLYVSFVVAFLFPIAIERVPTLFIPSESMPLWPVLMGLGAMGVLFVFGALVAILRRGPDRIVTFDARGIHETVGSKCTDLPWAWAERIEASGHTLTIYGGAPMQTMRFTAQANLRIFVVRRDSPDIEHLETLLARFAAHATRVALHGASS